ncbi:hypothetical protein [uncultured Maricaulis sp.]|uniref:hypothetical protein n=1 Tax=uncultured Maricaulis sp. TaxID=174710 RepID=UPI0030D96979
MSLINKLTVVCAAALALGACDAATETVALAAMAPAEPEAEVSERGGDAWCDEFAEGEGAGTDCALRVDDQRFVYLDYLTDEDGYASQMVLTQHSFAGDLLARSEPIDVEPVYGVAALRDLDGNGAAELLIPLFAGNVNTVFAVWRQDATGLFAPAGELSSYGIDSLETREGLVIAPSRGSAVTHYETASRFGADGLETVYEIEINYETRSCRLTDATGLEAAGIDGDALVSACEDRDWE